ncbi:MscL family protein [Nocardioides sp. zg-536]|uniref:MscL family protein n=1 Tax=Nocardioides faecalis TaxID=2803858 RepID=A0A938YBA9_9ACTN|nr:MscL family protein [Nocardioides faecalis]MBM9460866.1 MscL family protein [Nocardioides faecalis]MBS4751841.1 MscL family protein [Nocardioides faecalis]QVI59305.1 MscL family protein [Nocardioides faecalis]
MSGFKNFLLKGNLIELAVAFITATAFAAVVTTFTETLMGFIGKIFDQPDFGDAEISDVNVGHFINALIAFIILSAIVYFLIVVPYTAAKERFFPAEANGPTETELLIEIRDVLVAQNGGAPGAPQGPGPAVPPPV